MSDHGFHVHGPHDHELEHAAHGSIESFGGKLAVVTAVLATIGAIFSFMSGSTETESLKLENDAAVRRTEASNQWAAYLIASGKQNLTELALELAPESKRTYFQGEAKRRVAEMATHKLAAERLDADAIALDNASDELLRRHHRWSQATTVLQIAIAMAAIALLTKRRWLVFGVFSLGAIGAVIGTMAWVQV
jgi:hypothetical protein